MSRIILLLLLLGLCAPASARLYQWVDPDSGTTQLSGKPPAWYRGTDSGPRVFVFERGRLIDDTAKKVDAVKRDRLRQQALLQAEQDAQAATEKLQQARQIQALLQQQRESRQEETVSEPPPRTAEPTPLPTPAEQVPEESTEEKMRALLEQWEKLQSEDARKLLRNR